MSDLISREEFLKRIEPYNTDDKMDKALYNFAYNKMMDCSSVEPERKTGKWEYIQYDGNPKIGNWHCSNCRLIVYLGFEGAPYYDYCPGCGAKMEVQNDN